MRMKLQLGERDVDVALNHAIIIMPNDNREWGKRLIMIMMMVTVDRVLNITVSTPLCQNTLPGNMYAHPES